jgi:hypothetical protein
LNSTLESDESNILKWLECDNTYRVGFNTYVFRVKNKCRCQKICNEQLQGKLEFNCSYRVTLLCMNFITCLLLFFTKFSVSDSHSWNIMSPRQPFLGMQVHGHLFLGHYVRQTTIPRKESPWTTIPRILRPPDNHSD